MSVDYGNNRQIWLATLDAPTTKFPFLVRDEASAKGSALFGRTVRLGEPVTLGPNSTWRSKSWEGGQDQDIWRDEQMYQSGDANGVTKRGRLKLWTGYKQLYAHGSRAVSQYAMSPGASGWGSDTGLWLGENNPQGRLDGVNGTAVPDSGFALMRYDPTTGVTTVKQYLAAGINSIARMNDQGNSQLYLAIGLTNGKFYQYYEPTNGIAMEKDHAGLAVDGIVAYGDAMYYGAGGSLWKRTYAATPGVVHAKVKDIPNTTQVKALTVWNNRLWFAAVGTGNRTSIYVSDGVTVTLAFSFPHNFHARQLVNHYGALYVIGETTAALGTGGNVGQVWKYNGSSLVKLFEEGDGRDNKYHWSLGATSYDRFLVWTKNGFPDGAGLMLYDAEVDAIITGPTIKADTSATTVYCTNVIEYNNTLVAAFYDTADYGTINTQRLLGPTMVATWNRDGGGTNDDFSGLQNRSFAQAPNTAGVREQYVLSSQYDGEIPGEQKTWLTGRLLVKVPQYTEVKVYALLDESSTETLVATITYDAAQPNFRNVVFPLKGGDGKYLKSTTIRYKLYLRHTDRTAEASTAVPEVDTLEVDFMPKPRHRRQWRERAVCTDAQLTLAGTANPLTTKAALAQKLEDLYKAQEPVLLWPALSTSGEPANGTGTEVMITDWLEQTSRVTSDATEELAEVALTFTEVVTT